MIRLRKYLVLFGSLVALCILFMSAKQNILEPELTMNKSRVSFLQEEQVNLVSFKKVDWNQAKWIGYTKDHRSEKWAARDLIFNRPPFDISTWEPTPEDLKPSRRKVNLSPLMRKKFTITKAVKSATVAVCGLGLYELYLNGKKVGNHVLDPAQTSYDKRAFYVTHDVTTLLAKNKNVIGLMLGNGFFGQNMAFAKGLSYGQPRAILVLDMEYADGTTEQIVTDESWKAHDSPILFDNIYHGETYDARKEIEDWSHSSLNDASWDAVELMDAPTDNLLEQDIEPMRKIRKVEPVAILPAEKGWIIDMGQNMTGWLAIAIEEAEGTEIKMSFAEHLMPNKQNIDPASTGIHVTGGTQTDIYICKGNGVENWEPRFTYHGFRYVQIEGLSKKPDITKFTGWLVRSDVERIGTFKCSNALINTFYEVSMWTIEDNIQGLLSDCPHRERCAWMGDSYAVAEVANFNFDLKRLWRKTSADTETVLGVSRAHFKDSFPYDSRAPSNISVGKRLCLQARPDWGAATVMIPWFSYVYYGDEAIIKNAWDMMVGWMAYLDEKVQNKGIIDGGFGDWCPPGSNADMDTPPALTSTALYYQSLMAMQKMAAVMNDDNLVSKYEKNAIKVKQAFNDKFFTANQNSYGSQTGNAFALYSGLVRDGKEQLVADNLAQLIMADKQGHYSTGIFGHRPLYTVLNDYGHEEVTKHLWSITDYPSLGFLTEEHDLTTWPENPANWDKEKRYFRSSFNHPMHSGFAASFHESLGGIRPDEINPGFKQFFLKPTFLTGVDWVEVSYKSPHGIIESNWKKQGSKIVWSITVPDNSSAFVQLPAYTSKQIKLNHKKVKNNTFELTNGRYVITVQQ